MRFGLLAPYLTPKRPRVLHSEPDCLGLNSAAQSIGQSNRETRVVRIGRDRMIVARTESGHTYRRCSICAYTEAIARWYYNISTTPTPCRCTYTYTFAAGQYEPAPEHVLYNSCVRPREKVITYLVVVFARPARAARQSITQSHNSFVESMSRQRLQRSTQQPQKFWVDRT